VVAAFGSGFAISFGLILAIGAQNAFVLRQGLLRQYIVMVVLFCALSDAVLICAGVFGLGRLFAPIMQEYQNVIFVGAALWLGWYGGIRLYRAIIYRQKMLDAEVMTYPSRWKVLVAVGLMTWLNPHVYLDTLLLIATLSLGLEMPEKIAFAGGACLASLIFFCTLGFGAARLSPLMKTARSWQIADSVIAGIMFVLAISMLFQTSWFQHW